MSDVLSGYATQLKNGLTIGELIESLHEHVTYLQTVGTEKVQKIRELEAEVKRLEGKLLHG